MCLQDLFSQSNEKSNEVVDSKEEVKIKRKLNRERRTHHHSNDADAHNSPDASCKDELKACTNLWHKLEPYLRNISSYEFYCEPHNSKTQGMVEVLEAKRQCFEGIISYCCGLDIGSIMSELIRRVYDDPLYLRFIYRADCHLHKNASPRRHGRHQGSRRDKKPRHHFAIGPDSNYNHDAHDSVYPKDKVHSYSSSASELYFESKLNLVFFSLMFSLVLRSPHIFGLR